MPPGLKAPAGARLKHCLGTESRRLGMSRELAWGPCWSRVHFGTGIEGCHTFRILCAAHSLDLSCAIFAVTGTWKTSRTKQRLPGATSSGVWPSSVEQELAEAWKPPPQLREGEEPPVSPSLGATLASGGNQCTHCFQSRTLCQPPCPVPNHWRLYHLPVGHDVWVPLCLD